MANPCCLRGRALRTVLPALALVALVCPAAGAQAPRIPLPPVPQSFLLEHTDQLGFPGQAAGTAVTPEGDLFTGWAELALRVGFDKPFNPATHSLELGRFPIVRAFRVERGVLYTLTTFQTSVAGRPVAFARVEVRNLLAGPTSARVAAAIRHDGGQLAPRFGRCCVRINRFPRPRDPGRPGLYFQPGVGFNTDFGFAFNGLSLERDGQAVLFYPPGDSRTRVTQQLRFGSSVNGPLTQWGRTLYDVRLPRAGYAALDFTLPVEPVAPGTPEHAAIDAARLTTQRALLRNHWRRVLAPAVQIDVPEAKVDNTFYTSLVNLAMSRYLLADGSWVQTVNKLRYHAFWLRDAAVITNAFDLAGLHGLAAENLGFFQTWQRKDGLFISRPQEFDGFGQALWAMGEHVRRTGNQAFARAVYPNVQRAMEWFEAQRAKDPLSLMPAVQTTFDNDLVAGHLTGDNFWASAGVSGAIDIARAAGATDAATRWTGVLFDFRARLREHIARVAGPNAAIPPSLDVRGGQVWGMLWGTYPGAVYTATHPVTRATLARARAAFREGILSYGNRTRLHHYSGFRVFQTELMAGLQQRVVRGLFDTLAHTTGTNAGFEAGAAPFGDRIVDDATVPHGWWAAEYVALLRNMLIREAGPHLMLMSAVSPNWLGARKRITVRNAPTSRGRISYSLFSFNGGATLTWRATVAPGTRLLWAVPYSARSVVARGLSRDRRTIMLPAPAGRLTVRWRIVGPPESHDLQFRRLMGAYLRSPTGAAARARAARHAGPAASAQGAEDLNGSALPGG